MTVYRIFDYCTIKDIYVFYKPYVMKSVENGKRITSGFFVSVLIVLIGFNSPLVLGHNFSPDESAKFLGLVDIIKGEAQLVQEDLASKNVSLANQHANKALTLVTDTVTKEITERNPRLSGDLNTALATLKNSTTNPSMASDVNSTVSDLDDILDEIVTARIEPEKSSNSTIQALRLVEILDGVLRNYGDAYAVGFDMTNMSMMMMGDGGGGMAMDMGGGGMSAMSSMDMGSAGGGGNMSNGGMTGMQVGAPTTEGAPIGIQKQSESSMGGMSMPMGDMSSSQQLVNMTDYQTARILAQKAQELFNSQLVNASISGTPENVINDIVAAFQELNSSIDEKASPMDIMMVVHTKIHPNMITAFGLQLGGST
jgi:hypothetical protein